MPLLKTTIAPVEIDTNLNCEASQFVNQYIELYQLAIESRDFEALEILDKKTRQWFLALQSSVENIIGEELRIKFFQQAMRAQYTRVQQAAQLVCDEQENIKGQIGSSKRAKHYTCV